ncbi:MAG: glycosyltransferase family 4 protein [Candidatus Hydrogenedentes bacterium]|nr:glycosyltransferase family 4 protein [Candidatus Hydrogenedentota bacterium]
MKVLLDARQASNGSGTGRYTTELTRALLEHDADLDLRVVWPRDRADQSEWLKTDRLVPCSDRASWSGRLNRLRTLQREVAAFKPDIVHYPANIAGPGTIAGSGKTKMVLTLHDATFMRDPSWFTRGRAAYYRYAARRSVQRADRLITDSECSASDIRRYLDAAETPIDVIPLGVNEVFAAATDEQVKRIRKKLDLPNRFFLFVGTLEPRKNLLRVIEAWSSIVVDTDTDLVIAGRSGWKTRSLEALLSRTLHRERVHRIGFVDDRDLPALMTAASALVWPSLWEGFGFPPLEAMACGTPVLTSNLSSFPEVYGDAALLVSPTSVHEIAEGMLRISRDEKLRERLRTQGLECARNYTWRRTAEMTIESYRKTLQSET